MDVGFAVLLGGGLVAYLVVMRGARDERPLEVPNVPIGEITGSQLVHSRGQNPIQLPDGEEVEVLGITASASDVVWDLEGAPLEGQALARFREVFKIFDANRSTRAPISLVLRVPSANQSGLGPAIDWEDGLFGGYSASYDLSSDGRAHVLFSPSSYDPLQTGSIRVSYSRGKQEPQHVATVGLGRGSENGIRWNLKGPLATAKRGEPFAPNSAEISVSERLVGAELMLRPDREVRKAAPIDWMFPSDVVPNAKAPIQMNLMTLADDAKHGYYWHLYAIPRTTVVISAIPLKPR